MQGYNGATAGTTKCVALARAGKTMHRDGSDSSCTATTRAAQTMHCNGKSTAAKEHASRRREQGTLCIAAAAQRQRQACIDTTRAAQTMHRYGEGTAGTEHVHRDGESRADHASQQWRNGNDRAYPTTARAGQTMHRPTAATEHTLRRREQHRLCVATAKRWQPMHRDGESRADYARVQRRDDRHAKTTTSDT